MAKTWPGLPKKEAIFMVTSSNGSRRWLSSAARRTARSPETAGRAGVLVAFGLMACGLLTASCSSSSPSAGPDKFVGTWTFDSGTLTPTNCQGVQPSSLVGETLTLAKGTSSDLTSTLQSSFG